MHRTPQLQTTDAAHQHGADGDNRCGQHEMDIFDLAQRIEQFQITRQRQRAPQHLERAALVGADDDLRRRQQPQHAQQPTQRTGVGGQFDPVLHIPRFLCRINQQAADQHGQPHVYGHHPRRQFRGDDAPAQPALDTDEQQRQRRRNEDATMSAEAGYSDDIGEQNQQPDDNADEAIDILDPGQHEIERFRGDVVGKF